LAQGSNVSFTENKDKDLKNQNLPKVKPNFRVFLLTTQAGLKRFSPGMENA